MVATEKGALMTNSYFNYTNPVQPGDRIESNKYNGDFAAIARAFDTLPSPEELATNTSNYSVSQGTPTAYSVSLPNFDITFGYIEGMQVIMKAHVTNTGSATISINGAPAVILRNRLTGSSGNGYALVAGDIVAGAIYSIRYDGTEFQVVNTVANALISSQTAANSATASASAASTSANAATNAATAAGNSATAAASSASTATNAANNAANAAATATNAANDAISSANSAVSSANSASTSATTATNQASIASGAASASATSATNAASAAASAQNYASQAATSATNAAASAASAQAVLTSTAFKNAVIAQMLSTSGTLRVNCTKFYAADINPNALYPGTTWVKLPADTAIRTALLDGSDVMTTSGAMDVTLSTDNLPSHTHSGTVALNQYNYGTITSGGFSFPALTTSSFNFGTVTVDSYNYGTITSGGGGSATVLTSTNGAHNHQLAVTNIGTGTSGFIVGQGSAPATNVNTTDSLNHDHFANFPSHTHQVTVPSHNHTINLGSHSHSINLGSHTHSATVSAHNHTVTVSVNNYGQGNSFSIRNRAVKLVGWRRTA